MTQNVTQTPIVTPQSPRLPSIAITGGKGGTGKTLIATNLAVSFANAGKRVLLVDCDVENPNTNILLGKSFDDDDVKSEPVMIYKPTFNKDLCTQCGLCRSSCYLHAILQFPEHYPTLMEHMCSGCKTCERICPTNAIEPAFRPIGTRYFAHEVKPNLDLMVGELIPSEALSAHIVENLIEWAFAPAHSEKYDLIVLDSAPGVHCDVEKTLLAADIVINVTEPTPFGEHDLRRILELLKLVEKKSYVIMNRANLTTDAQKILDDVTSSALEYVGKIDVDRTLIEDYAKGLPFVLDPRDFPAKTQFLQIFHTVEKILSHSTNQETI